MSYLHSYARVIPVSDPNNVSSGKNDWCVCVWGVVSFNENETILAIRILLIPVKVKGLSKAKLDAHCALRGQGRHLLVKDDSEGFGNSRSSDSSRSTQMTPFLGPIPVITLT